MLMPGTKCNRWTTCMSMRDQDVTAHTLHYHCLQTIEPTNLK